MPNRYISTKQDGSRIGYHRLAESMCKEWLSLGLEACARQAPRYRGAMNWRRLTVVTMTMKSCLFWPLHQSHGRNCAGEPTRSCTPAKHGINVNEQNGTETGTRQLV